MDIYKEIKGWNFNVLEVKDWIKVIKSLIREDKDHKVAVGLESVNQVISSYDSLGIASALSVQLSGHGADFDEIPGASLRLKQWLPTPARRKFSEALTNLTKSVYERQDTHDQYEVFQALERISALFDGAVYAELAQQIALDEAVDVGLRSRFSIQLVDQSFSNSSPISFWEKLAKQVVGYPELAPALVAKYVEEDNPTEALKMLVYVLDENGELDFCCPALLEMNIDKALKQLRYRTNWKRMLADTLHHAPRRVGLFIQKVVTESDMSSDLKEEVGIFLQGLVKN